MKLAGKYELSEVLGTGGMGTVWSAMHESENGFRKRCVVKVLHSRFTQNEDLLGLFRQEARLVAQMAHPGIPQVFDYGVENEKAFIVMERVDGPTLQQVIVQLRELKQQVPPEIAARIISSVCEALAYAHALAGPDGKPLGLVHRDVSPDNVMIDRTGVVKLTDFGVARVADSAVKTAVGKTRGKYRYMAPEQLAGETVTARCDVFAVSVVLCELLTGQHPWPGQSDLELMQQIPKKEPRSPRSLRADLPPALDALIRRGLEKAPAARIQSCRELQRALETFITSTGKPVTSFEVAAWLETLDGAEPGSIRGNTKTDPALPPPASSSGGARSVVPTARSRKPAALIVAALTVCVLGLGGYALRPDPSPANVQVIPLVAPEVIAPTPEVPDPRPPPEPQVELTILPGEVERTRPRKPVAPKTPEPMALGEVELRVRPWATVYVDGKIAGDTPLANLKLSVGAHQFRLVNTGMGKDLTRTVSVKPGLQQVKFNLNEP